MQTPTAATLTDDNLESGMQLVLAKWANDVKVISRESVPLCRAGGTHYALSATARGIPIAIDLVVSAGSPTTYLAIYLRRSTDAVEPQAEQAIRSLCPSDRITAG